MNLEQLRGFVEVAATGHFTRAAGLLHVAQPTLSRQVSHLEAELGSPLFHRMRGHVVVTDAGELLLPIARRMLADADAARSSMSELAGLRRGHVRVGATPTLCASLLADVLGEFHRRHPGVDIEVLERGSRSLIAALAEGGLDLALVVTSVSSGPARSVLELEPILRERLLVVSSAKHDDPFSGENPVGLRALVRAPQIAFPKNYDLRAAMDAVLHAHDLEPSIVVEGAEMDAALRFAERGIGVAVVPAMVAGLHPALRAAPLADPAFMRTVSVARRSDMRPTRAGAALQALIREVAGRLTGPAGAAGAAVTRPA